MSTETYTSRPYRALSFSAFIVGLAAVAWVASGFVGSSAFALGMTLLIGTVYLGGAWELRRFGQTTADFHAAMASVPQPLAQLADWLPSVPAPLRNAVMTCVWLRAARPLFSLRNKIARSSPWSTCACRASGASTWCANWCALTRAPRS